MVALPRPDSFTAGVIGPLVSGGRRGGRHTYYLLPLLFLGHTNKGRREGGRMGNRGGRGREGGEGGKMVRKNT